MTELDPGSADTRGYFGGAMAADGTTLAVGAEFHNFDPGDGPVDAGAVYIFEMDTGGADQWGLTAKILHPEPQPQTYFSSAISISGNTLAVGAPNQDDSVSSQGKVYVFERNQPAADGWGLVAALTPSVPVSGDFFGWSVSLDGDLLAVGVPGRESGSEFTDGGAVFVYQRDAVDPHTWDLVTTIEPDGLADNGAYTGGTVQIDQSGLVYGCIADGFIVSTDSRIYVVEGSAGDPLSWTQVAAISVPEAENKTLFGRRIFPNGDQLFVSAPTDGFNPAPNGGAVYLFERNQGGTNAWGLRATLRRPGSVNSSDGFGASLIGIPDGLIVGAPGVDNGAGTESGQAFILRQVPSRSTLWYAGEALIPGNTGEGDQFGFSGTIAGDLAALGAPGLLGFNTEPGKAYLFSPTGRTQPTYSEWLATVFAPEDLDPEDEGAIWGTAADPDGDATINLLEYHQGLDPWVFDGPGALAVGLGTTTSSFTYLVSKDAREGSLAVEWSDDLVTWHETGIVETIEIDASDYLQVRAETPLQVGEVVKFWRLRSVGP